MRRGSFLKLMVVAPLAALLKPAEPETVCFDIEGTSGEDWFIIGPRGHGETFPFEKAHNIEVPSVAAQVEADQRELNRLLQKKWYHAERYSMSPEQFRRVIERS